MVVCGKYAELMGAAMRINHQIAPRAGVGSAIRCSVIGQSSKTPDAVGMHST